MSAASIRSPLHEFLGQTNPAKEPNNEAIKAAIAKDLQEQQADVLPATAMWKKTGAKTQRKRASLSKKMLDNNATATKAPKRSWKGKEKVIVQQPKQGTVVGKWHPYDGCDRRGDHHLSRSTSKRRYACFWTIDGGHGQAHSRNTGSPVAWE